MMPVIANRWPCTNIYCCNKGKTCQQKKKLPDSPDIAVNYYPISAEIFQQWNKELLFSDFIVDKPSPNIIIDLANYKEREKNWKGPKEQVVKKENTLREYLKQLVLISIINQVQFIGQNPHLPYQYSTPSSNIEAPQNLSPVWSEIDPVELLSQFFNWLANKLNFSNKKQRVTLGQIKDKLVEEKWNIKSLKLKTLGEGMMSDQWERYSFKVGMLVRIKPLISKFK